MSMIRAQIRPQISRDVQARAALPDNGRQVKSQPQPCDPDLNLAQAAKAVGNVSSRNFAQQSSAVSANSIGAQQLQSMFLQRGVRV